jgi:hypothetical protein
VSIFDTVFASATLSWEETLPCPHCGKTLRASVRATGIGDSEASFILFGRQQAKAEAREIAEKRAAANGHQVVLSARCPSCKKRLSLWRDVVGATVVSFICGFLLLFALVGLNSLLVPSHLQGSVQLFFGCPASSIFFFWFIWFVARRWQRTADHRVRIEVEGSLRSARPPRP